jgi:rSAM/selenodomain-associated transferase 2
MNRAAECSRGELLLFLHADTILPEGFAAQVRQTLRNPGIALGAFRLSIEGKGTLLRVVERTANWRSLLLSAPYGDQALFLRRETFVELGGFRPIPIMEDYDLVLRARRLGRVKILPQAVRTSARRWNRLGVLRTTLVNWLLVGGFHLGVPPDRLARWYK